jgi:hypothetical protein
MPSHIHDAIAAATGAADPVDLLSRTEGDPVLHTVAEKISLTCDLVFAEDQQMRELGAKLTGLDLTFDAHSDGGGDTETYTSVLSGARAMSDIADCYGTRALLAAQLEHLLDIFKVCDQNGRPRAAAEQTVPDKENL